MIPLAAAHAAAMAAIHAAALPPAERWDEAAMATLLAQPCQFGFIDCRGGFVLARTVADEAEILTLAVAPPVRRRRIGRLLLQEAAAEALRRAASSLFLEVSESNAAARQLYARVGLVQVGRRRDYYADGSAALVLRCDLGTPGKAA